MPAAWTFYLTDAGGNNLAELVTASGRSIAFKRNSYTEVQLTLSHEDDAAALLLQALNNTGVPKLKAYRRGVGDSLSGPAPLRFRGPLAALSEQSDENSTLTCTFRSPFSVLVGDGDKTGRYVQGGTTTGDGFPLIYTALDAGLMANSLIDTANRDSPTGLATSPGLVVATKLRDRTYPVGQNIGSAVTDLTAVLDGFDFYETFMDQPALTFTPATGGPANLTVTDGIGPFGLPYFGTGTFYWIVTAVVGGVESGASNEVTRTLNFSGGREELSWTAVPGATSYRIYRAQMSEGEFISPAFVASTASTFYEDSGTAVTTGAVPSSSTPPWLPDAYFNVTPSLGIVNPNARFEYGANTLANVYQVQRNTTPPQNCIFITGGNGLTSTYMDAASVGRYGKWWGRADFSTIVDQPTLDDKARGLCRPAPVKTVMITPDLGLSPLPFDDWNLGDTVPFYASRSALQDNTMIRINGFVLPISDDGFESIQVNDASNPEEDSVIRASLIAEVVVADGGSIPG